MSDLIAEVSIASFVRYEGGSPGGFSVYTAHVMTAIGGALAAGIESGSTIQVRQAGQTLRPLADRIEAAMRARSAFLHI